MGILGRLQHLRNHWFVRSTAMLQAGNLAGTFIQGIAGIFIARLLQPELFGVYSLAFSLAGVLSVFIGITSHEMIAAILGEAYARRDSGEILGAMAFTAKMIVVSGLAAILSFVIAPIISTRLYGRVDVGLYAAIFTLALFLSNSFFAMARVALQLVGRISVMTWLGVSDQFVRSVLSLGMVIMGLGVLGAVGGHFIGGLIVAIISMWLFIVLRARESIFPSMRMIASAMQNIDIRRYLGFSIWVAIDRNISVLYGMLPLVLLGIFATAAEIGFFRLAFSYINLVLGLLAPISILLNVELPRMRIERGQQLRKNFVRVSLYSTGLSALLTAGAVVVSPVFVRLLYGVAFLPSIPYVAGLFVYGVVYGLGIALGPMWRAVNKVKVSILVNTFTLGIGVPAGLLMIRYFGLWGGIVMVTLWYAVSHVVSFIYLVRRLDTLGTASGV